MRQGSEFSSLPVDSKAISLAVLVTSLIGFGWAILEVGTRQSMAVTGGLVAQTLTEFTASPALRRGLKLLMLALLVVFFAAS